MCVPGYPGVRYPGTRISKGIAAGTLNSYHSTSTTSTSSTPATSSQCPLGRVPPTQADLEAASQGCRTRFQLENLKFHTDSLAAAQPEVQATSSGSSASHGHDEREPRSG
eukprot:2193274-Rhodomonas_salina.1